MHLRVETLIAAEQLHAYGLVTIELVWTYIT